MNNFTSQRQSLRKLMRAKRLALSEQQQHAAAQQIIQPALSLIEQYQAEHIAFYLPFNGEISPLALMQRLEQQGKKCYLPILHPFAEQQLLFLRYHNEHQLNTNRFGILEPRLDVRNVLPLPQLQMIFTPLVAYDLQGNRLGMGGGFYDRTLAQSNAITVGLAHRCQQVEQLPTEPWDMPLKHIIAG